MRDKGGKEEEKTGKEREQVRKGAGGTGDSSLCHRAVLRWHLRLP